MSTCKCPVSGPCMHLAGVALRGLCSDSVAELLLFTQEKKVLCLIGRGLVLTAARGNFSYTLEWSTVTVSGSDGLSIIFAYSCTFGVLSETNAKTQEITG